MITIPRAICADIQRGLSREWLVTNGIGGYASGTVTGVNTRRYHGLLVAALKPPVKRTVLLSTIEEEVTVDDRQFRLGANEYPGNFHPTGYLHIEEFRLENGLPTTVYRLGDATFHKTVWMEHGRNIVYVRYTYVDGSQECGLALHAMCNCRGYHDMTQGDFDWNFAVEPVEGGCRVRARDDSPDLWLTSFPEAEFTPTGVWYWRHVYRQEVERGYDQTEDLYLPGVLRARLRPGESFTLVAATEPPEVTATLLEGSLEREQARQRGILTLAGLGPSPEEGDPTASNAAFHVRLVQAADAFLVGRQVATPDGPRRVPTVIAGYHWFTDWGRDTMISLPGLCLTTGRTRDAIDTIKAFALFVRDGLLPNNFPDTDSPPEHNTVDATLWMFTAIERVMNHQIQAGEKDLSWAFALVPVLQDIVEHHIAGTAYNIHMDPSDGLIYAGEEGVQLTWMDARVEGWVVTPRIGKPVEISGLWYAALRVLERLRSMAATAGRDPGVPPRDYAALAAKARRSFSRCFWYDEGGYFYDVIGGPVGNDAALRPNQLIALASGIISPRSGRARSALNMVRRHLLTPYGLRTLSPSDPLYEPQYTGDRVKRDGAYHQGTVWPWLLGPYLDSVLAIEGRQAAKSEMGRLLVPLKAHMAEAGLGTISEIFDAAAPHTPRGCIAQAWSVAEVLRHYAALMS